MSLDESVPRAAEAQEELHESVERLGRLTDLLADSRREFPEVEPVRSEYDRFANGVADYMENEAEELQGYLGELLSSLSVGPGRGNFMSPIFNFGRMQGVPDRGVMNPVYNPGEGDPDTGGSYDPDDYDWSGWETVQDPRYEIPDEPNFSFDTRAQGEGPRVIYNAASSGFMPRRGGSRGREEEEDHELLDEYLPESPEAGLWDRAS